MNPSAELPNLTENDKQYIIRLIRRTLSSLSVKIGSKGGVYLSDMLYSLLVDHGEMGTIADALSSVSDKYEIDAESIRASMRYALTQAWKIGDPEIQYRYFGRSVDFSRGKPTESAFIATLAMHMRHEIKAYLARCVPDDGIPPEMKLLI